MDEIWVYAGVVWRKHETWPLVGGQPDWEQDKTDVQYMMASNTSHTSGRSSTGGPISRSSGGLPPGSSEVESLRGVAGVAGDGGLTWGCCVLLLLVLRGAFFLPVLRARDMTWPGASQVNGFLSAYPGQTMPAVRHLAQTGCVPSQTSRRRRHSQHCSWDCGSACSDVSAMSTIFPFCACGWRATVGRGRRGPAWWTRAISRGPKFPGSACGTGSRLCPVAVGRRGRGSFPHRSLGHCIFLIGKELCMPGTQATPS